MPGDIITQAEAEELAELLGCDQRDICRACGKKVNITIFRGSGHCCDNCRKKRAGERPTPPGPALPG
jgi:hypothetical protein